MRTAARSGSMSRPCTSTSRRSGSPASPSPTRCAPATGRTAGTTWTPGSASRTDATMTPLPDTATAPAEAGRRVRRFTPAERWIHRTTAALLGVCVVSAACLYVPALAQLVGRRALVVTVHEWTGILTPVPALVGLASRASRADRGRLTRFGPHARRWLRAALRRDHSRAERPAGKFNAGQKVYAAWTAGAARGV